jgi:hypothetical protein
MNIGISVGKTSIANERFSSQFGRRAASDFAADDPAFYTSAGIYRVKLLCRRD